MPEIDLASARTMELPVCQLPVMSEIWRYASGYDSFQDPDSSFEDSIQWFHNEHGTPFHPDWMVTTSGTYGAYRLLVQSLNISTIAKTSAGSTIHERAFTTLGVAIDHVAADQDSCFPDIDSLREYLIDHPSSAVYANATDGRFPSVSYLHSLLELLRTYDTTLILDMDGMFTSTTDRSPMHDVLSIDGILDHSYILCTLSKEFGLPGLRLGYLLTSAGAASDIRHYKSNSLELEPAFNKKVAAEVIRSGAVSANVALINDRRSAVAALLQQAGMNYIEPTTGVNVFIRSQDVARLVRAVKARGVAVAEGLNYGTPFEQYVRVTLGASSEQLRRSIKIIIDEEHKI